MDNFGKILTALPCVRSIQEDLTRIWEISPGSCIFRYSYILFRENWIDLIALFGCMEYSTMSSAYCRKQGTSIGMI